MYVARLASGQTSTGRLGRLSGRIAGPRALERALDRISPLKNGVDMVGHLFYAENESRESLPAPQRVSEQRRTAPRKTRRLPTRQLRRPGTLPVPLATHEGSGVQAYPVAVTRREPVRLG